MKWEKVKIKDVSEGIYDGPHATPAPSDSGAIFLGISNITIDGHLDLSSIKYISETDLPNWTKRVTPKEGDIVFSYEATLNLYAIIPKGFYGCLGRRMALIRPNENKVNRKFLYYFFFSEFWRAIIAENTITGSTVDRIPIAKFPDFIILLPAMEAQERIASILSSYDELIENNQKQIKLLEEAAQRLYKEWFVDLRFPGHDDVEVVDGLPAGWEVNPINVIAKFHSGYAFKSSDFNKEGIYKIITIKNVLDGSFDGDKTDKIIVIPDKLPKHCVLSDGDILLSLTGNVGRVCLVYGENYLLNQRVAKIESSYPAYIYLLLRSREMFNEMNNLSNGAAQQNLSPIKTSNIKVVIPDEKILDLFENLLSPVIKNIIQLNKHNVVLKEARDRLLPKVMNGEVEV